MIMVEHSIPQWLQKELDDFGVFLGVDTPQVKITRRSYPEPTGWMPLYFGEEPPF